MSSYRDAQPPGLELTAELQTWDSTRTCPRCNFGLYSARKDTLELDACGRCGGVWLRADQADRAQALASRAHEELALKVERVTRPVGFREAAPIPCLECAAPMVRRVVSAVIVDTCSHGTWFDRTELVAILRARSGEPRFVRGLDAAFLREHADREKTWGPLMAAMETFRRLVE